MNFTEIFIEEKWVSPEELKAKYGAEFLLSCFERGVITKVKEWVKFSYVGIILFNDKSFFVFPKYYTEVLQDSNVYNKHAMFYLDVLEKAQAKLAYNIYKEEEINTIDSKFSLYAELMRYYTNYGLFESFRIRRTNDYDDKVNWTRTVESFTPFHVGDSVFYPDVISTKNIVDTNHFITELQKQVTQIAYNEYGCLRVGFEDPNLDSKDILEHFEHDFLIQQIQNKLNHTFIDNEIYLLNMLIKYLEGKKYESKTEVSLLGSRTFYNVWELACKYVFKDQYTLYSDFIPKPIWDFIGESYIAHKTLIPDIVYSNDDMLVVLDAKYYLPQFNDSKVSKQPGVDSLTKQILYELVLKNHPELEVKPVKNGFVFPVQSNDLFDEDLLAEEIEKKGGVKFDYQEYNSLPSIDSFYIEPSKLFRCFLNNVSIPLEEVYGT